MITRKIIVIPWNKILKDINFVPYFLLKFLPAAIEISPSSKNIVVNIIKIIINSIDFFLK